MWIWFQLHNSIKRKVVYLSLDIYYNYYYTFLIIIDYIIDVPLIDATSHGLVASSE